MTISAASANSGPSPSACTTILCCCSGSPRYPGDATQLGLTPGAPAEENPTSADFIGIRLDCGLYAAPHRCKGDAGNGARPPRDARAARCAHFGRATEIGAERFPDRVTQLAALAWEILKEGTGESRASGRHVAANFWLCPNVRGASGKWGPTIYAVIRDQRFGRSPAGATLERAFANVELDAREKTATKTVISRMAAFLPARTTDKKTSPLFQMAVRRKGFTGKIRDQFKAVNGKPSGKQPRRRFGRRHGLRELDRG
jgi:hypothetical protein